MKDLAILRTLTQRTICVLLVSLLLALQAEIAFSQTTASFTSHEIPGRAPKKLEVFPNPGKDFVILAYQLDKESKGMIEIRDISGKPVQSIPFNGMQDQVTVVTTSWEPGIYTISLTAGGETVETVKFTLVK